MRTVVCGANGAMGQLICGILGEEVVGKVSIDGENGVPKTFDELFASEEKYLDAYLQHPIRTDIRYFFLTIRSILFRGLHSA